MDNLFRAPSESEELLSAEGEEQYVYAGFWIRLLASIIDTIVLLIAGVGLVFLFTVLGMEGALSGDVSWLDIVVGLLYYVGFWTIAGATPGKQILRLKIITAETGNIPGVWRSLGRYLATILSALIFMIGFLMVAWDKEKRALHDLICGTRVIRL